MQETKELNKYSYSKVNHFYNCPYSFYKNYFEKVIGESHGTAEFGSYVHFILELYEKNELKIDELLNYYIQNYGNNVKADFTLVINERFSKNFSDDYFESGMKYFSEFKGFNDWKILEAEYNFEEVINDSFIFTGKVDLIAEDGNGDLIICDHKSKKGFKSKKELAEYGKQLYLYSYAVYKKYKRYPKKLIFNMFRNNEYKEIVFDKEDYDLTLDWLIRSVDEIENAFDFYTNYGTFYCRNFCPYRNMGYPDCKFNE